MLGEIKLGNVHLVEYGIQTEASDLRAHVCVVAKKVYVYRTEEGASLVKDRLSMKLQPRDVVTKGIITAQGYAIPVLLFKTIREVDIPQEWLDEVAFNFTDSTSVRGQKAVKIVSRFIRIGQLPYLAFEVKEVEGKTLQISGTDIEVPSMNTRLQVKCDWRGGFRRGEETTGNLFLQIRECNPFQQV